MKQENNVIQGAAKTLVNKTFFARNSAPRKSPEAVVPLFQRADSVLQSPAIGGPRVLIRPARQNYNSLALGFLALVCLSVAVAAFWLLPAKNENAAGAPVNDDIDDAVKTKILTAQKPSEPQPKQKSAASANQSETKKREKSAAASNGEENAPALTPDESEPVQWTEEESVAAKQETGEDSKPKEKKRGEKKAEDKIEDFVREVENAERKTRRLKKILDDINDKY